MAQRTEGAPAGAAAKRKSLSAYAEPAARFLMGFTLANAQVTGGIAPFGAAFAGAAPAGAAGIASTLGAAAGYLAGGELMWAVKYIAVMVLIRAAYYILAGTAVSEKALFPVITALAASLGVGFVYVYDGGWSIIPAVCFAVECFLTAGCVFFYSVALSPWEQSYDGSCGRIGHSVSSIILLATLLIALARVRVFGVMSVGRMLAVIAVMLLTFRGGIGAGCCFGAALGAAMDLAAGTSGVFTAAYVLSAIIAGLFSKNGRLLFALTFIAANAISVIWTWKLFARADALYETFAASVIFIIMPSNVIARLSSLFPIRASGYGFLRAREYTRERIDLIAAAFKTLTPALNSCADTAENPSVIFDRASAAVCADCPDMARCWQRDYADTFDIMNNITPRLIKYGKIEAGDLPARFTDKCVRLNRLVSEINSEERALRLRREYRSRISDSQRTALSQYAGIASLLGSVSAELGGGVTVDTVSERKLTKYLAGLNISASVAVFRVKGGRLRAEISGEDTPTLKRIKDWLEKLSEVLEVRLCTYDEGGGSGKIVLLEAEPISITVGTASIKKNGARVSGDKSVTFRTDEGIFYVLLSDGMGSGEAAHEISSTAAGAAESFLRAGVAPEIALGFIENAMFIKNDIETQSATIDLMSVNMFTGEARIYKYGAAPSYLKKDSVVKRITAQTFPAGLAHPSDKPVGAIKAKMPCGAFAVIISDGVISGTDDRWLRRLICDFDGGDPVELSREILERARLEVGASDDMTVLAVRTDARE